MFISLVKDVCGTNKLTAMFEWIVCVGGIPFAIEKAVRIALTACRALNS